jgi:hypothetical protein
VLIFATGFDYYTSVLQRWDIVHGSPPIQAGQGRLGTAGISVSGSGIAVFKNLGKQVSTIYTGVAVKVSAGGQMLNWLDNGTVQVSLVVQNDGSLQVQDSSAAAIGTSVYQIPFNTYVYVEVKLVIANGTGECTIRVDNAEVFSLTAVDTASTATTYATQFALGHMGSVISGGAGSFKFDDVYLCDETGTTNNTFLGDTHIEAIYPTGPGTYTDFALGGTTPAATNWESQDDATPNDEQDYVTSTTVDAKDSYQFGDLGVTTGDIPAVLVHNRLRKEQGGNRTYAALARTGGVDLDGPTKGMSTDYYTWPTILETKPGGGAWTIADVNAAEFGLRIIA